jgi:hypothetical protein
MFHSTIEGHRLQLNSLISNTTINEGPICSYATSALHIKHDILLYEEGLERFRSQTAFHRHYALNYGTPFGSYYLLICLCTKG